MTTSTTMIAAFFTVALLFAATRVAEGQSDNSCVESLVPCYAYLNRTDPSLACCNGIRTVVQTQLSCLCSLYNNPNTVATLGINVTQALMLPSHCGISNDTSVCSALSPGSSPPERHNGVGTISWTAMPAILMVWAITYSY